MNAKFQKQIDTALSLLQKQQNDPKESLDKIRCLLQEVRSDFEKVLFSKEKDGTQPLYDLNAILSEWQGMFSFSPGRSEGLPILIRLLSWLQTGAGEEKWLLYDQPEWKQLVALRGPIEEVCQVSCKKCQTAYFIMVTDGFADMSGYLTYPSGDVVFQSGYEDKAIPKPKEGTPYIRRCPKCNSDAHQITRSFSPYEYFATHQYRIL